MGNRRSRRRRPRANVPSVAKVRVPKTDRAATIPVTLRGGLSRTGDRPAGYLLQGVIDSITAGIILLLTPAVWWTSLSEFKYVDLHQLMGILTEYWRHFAVLAITISFLLSDYVSARQVNGLTPHDPTGWPRWVCDVAIPMLFGIAVYAISGPSALLPIVYCGIYLVGFLWSVVVAFGTLSSAATLRCVRHMVTDLIGLALFLPTTWVALKSYVANGQLSDGMLICIGVQYLLVELLDRLLQRTSRKWLYRGGRAAEFLLEAIVRPFNGLRTRIVEETGESPPDDDASTRKERVE